MGRRSPRVAGITQAVPGAPSLGLRRAAKSHAQSGNRPVIYLNRRFDIRIPRNRNRLPPSSYDPEPENDASGAGQQGYYGATRYGMISSELRRQPKSRIDRWQANN